MLSVLRRREFLWFTVGQTISSFGDKLHTMALIGLIGTLDPGSSALVLAGLAVLYCLPFLVVTPIAGFFVDRWNRKRTLIACDGARAVLVAAIPLAYAEMGTTPLFGLVAAVFILSLFFDVAKMAIIPDLVAPQELLSANAASSLLARGAALAGIVLGGIIVSWRVWERMGVSGYTGGFLADSVTFLISVMTLLAIADRPALGQLGIASSSLPGIAVVWKDLREVAATCRSEPRVLFVLATTALLGLVGGCMYVVVIVAVQTRTAWGTRGVGYVFGLMACGIVPGSALLGQFGSRWSRARVIATGFIVIGALILASARRFTFALHGPLSFLGGLALGPIMVAQDTMLHESLREAVRGRVFSARDVVLNVAFGLAAAATGVAVTILSRVGVEQPFRATLLVVGPLVLLAAIAAAARARKGSLV